MLTMDGALSHTHSQCSSLSGSSNGTVANFMKVLCSRCSHSPPGKSLLKSPTDKHGKTPRARILHCGVKDSTKEYLAPRRGFKLWTRFKQPQRLTSHTLGQFFKTFETFACHLPALGGECSDSGNLHSKSHRSSIGCSLDFEVFCSSPGFSVSCKFHALSKSAQRITLTNKFTANMLTSNSRITRNTRIRVQVDDVHSSGNGQGSGEEQLDAVDISQVPEITNLVQRMGIILKSDPGVANQAAASLVTSLDPQGRSVLMAALFSSASDDADDHFKDADTNSDGVIDRAEFGNYVEAQAIKYGYSSKPLTRNQTFHLFARAAVGMVGFGFTDNAIMIIAGDAIQNTIGGALGLTTLLSAGLGNAIADLVGTAFRGYIERISSKFMPDVHVSSIQLEQKEAWWAETLGASAGVTIGCILGLAPLFLIGRSEGKGSDGTDTPTSVGDGRGSGGSEVYIPVSDLIWVSDTGRQQYASMGEQAISSPFASVSNPLSPMKNFNSHGPQLQIFGGPVIVLAIVFVMALKRVREYRQKFRQQWFGKNL